MSIDIPIKLKIEVTKKFELSFKKSIEYSVKHIVKTIKNEMPTDSGKTKEGLNYSIDYRIGEAIIGWRKGSPEELVGSVLQFGSGQRGRDGGLPYIQSKNNISAIGPYQSQFGEQRPNYTVPIVPTNSKAMKFKGNDGKMKYMKEFKGHIPRYVLTKGLVKSMRFLPIVFSNEMNK